MKKTNKFYVQPQIASICVGPESLLQSASGQHASGTVAPPLNSKLSSMEADDFEDEEWLEDEGWLEYRRK